MGKVYGYFGFFILLIILFCVNFVIAQQTNFEKLGDVFSGINLDNLDFTANFSIILLGILLWMILYSVVGKMELFENNPFLIGAISLISTLLAFIYLKDQPTFLELIRGEFGALGATVLVIFPFLLAIYFTSLVSPSLIIARAIWGVFGLYYFLILLYTWGNSNLPFFSKETWWYVVAVLSSIILFIFIPFIRKGFWNIKLESKVEKGKRRVQKAAAGAKILAKAADEFSRGEGI